MWSRSNAKLEDGVYRVSDVHPLETKQQSTSETKLQRQVALAESSFSVISIKIEGILPLVVQMPF